MPNNNSRRPTRTVSAQVTPANVADFGYISEADEVPTHLQALYSNPPHLAEEIAQSVREAARQRQAAAAYTTAHNSLARTMELIRSRYHSADTREAREFYQAALNRAEDLFRMLVNERQTVTAAVYPGPSEGLNRTEAEWISLLELNKYRKPPKVLGLRTDKCMLVERIERTPLRWTQDDERSLNESRERLASMDRDDERRSDLQEHVRGMRESRRLPTAETIYKVSRGAYQLSFAYLQAADESIVSALRRGLWTFRRTLSHERKLLRNMRKLQGGHFGQRCGGTYERPGQVLRQLKKVRYQEVLTDKKPRQPAKHVGIELEFCAALGQGELMERLHEAGLGKYVTLKTDGSVRVSKNGDTPHELCILARESEYRKVVRRVTKCLIQAGGYVNRTCGMHVHLDMRQRKAPEAYERLMRSLNILYAMVPPRRRENRFCLRNPFGSTFGDRSTEGSDTRYLAVNPQAFRRHKTIEVRLHSGTLSTRKIAYWVELLLAVVDTPNTVVFKKAERLIEVLRLRPELAAYIQERVECFEKEGVEDDPEDQAYVDAREGHAEEVTPRCDCNTCRDYAEANRREENALVLPTYQDEVLEAA